ncbi:helix-turn-helix domain-containing protein [Dyella sedimenti]|uniref:helix-turn-helix domain-containing protein n=1 Tax=Dyella sedimenti TaxID=2919947 RepID=UPI001FA985EE|nr:helix-turn-helix transcriptional regulator [Dyella sedimenti]
MPQAKKIRPKSPAAPKSLHRPEYSAVLRALIEMREGADLLQAELGKRLGRSQSYVSMAERGNIRLDALQLHDWCTACGSSLVAFAKKLERQWAADMAQP